MTRLFARLRSFLGGLRHPARIDTELAGRMIRKSPGLTLVAGLGMTLSISVCVRFFTVTRSFLSPRIPLEECDRLVALENWDIAANDEDLRSLHDFTEWRKALNTVQPVAAAQMSVQRSCRVSVRRHAARSAASYDRWRDAGGLHATHERAAVDGVACRPGEVRARRRSVPVRVRSAG
jgi:hypothetical protein